MKFCKKCKIPIINMYKCPLCSSRLINLKKGKEKYIDVLKKIEEEKRE